MKLVVGMLVGPGEMGRYLRDAVTHALSYADELVALVDQPAGEDDGSFEWLADFGMTAAGVVAARREGRSFMDDESSVRQELLERVFARDPTHVLMLDADEFVPEGLALRAGAQRSPASVWLLRMVEIWDIASRPWLARMDGGWAPTLTSCLFAAPSQRERWQDDPEWRIRPVELACGREPMRVAHMAGAAHRLDVSVLHLGWADPATREGRARRYLERDGGRFHADWHLRSILWPRERCRLVEWPEAVALPYRSGVAAA